MNRLLTILAVTILNLFLTFPGFGQSQKMLSGVVLNDAKQPVSEVTINIPGSEPVYTNEDGVFNIPRVDEKEWLFVTPLEGYSSKEIFLTNQESIVIYLTSNDIESPHAKVLTPLDNKKGRDLISSFKALDPSKFENQLYTSA